MADTMIIRDHSRDPHPAGEFAAVCVDGINLGTTVEQYGDDPPQLMEKCALVFRTSAMQNGRHLHIPKTYTASLGPKANLRKDVEAWRGEPFTDREGREDGIALEALVGTGALLTIAHKKSQSGRTYAVISHIRPLPPERSGERPSVSAYTRATYWEGTKREYATKTAEFKAQQPVDLPNDEDDDDDDMPF